MVFESKSFLAPTPYPKEKKIESTKIAAILIHK